MERKTSDCVDTLIEFIDNEIINNHNNFDLPENFNFVYSDVTNSEAIQTNPGKKNIFIHFKYV